MACRVCACACVAAVATTSACDHSACVPHAPPPSALTRSLHLAVGSVTKPEFVGAVAHMSSAFHAALAGVAPVDTVRCDNALLMAVGGFVDVVHMLGDSPTGGPFAQLTGVAGGGTTASAAGSGSAAVAAGSAAATKSGSSTPAPTARALSPTPGSVPSSTSAGVALPASIPSAYAAFAGQWGVAPLLTMLRRVTLALSLAAVQLGAQHSHLPLHAALRNLVLPPTGASSRPAVDGHPRAGPPSSALPGAGGRSASALSTATDSKSSGPVGPIAVGSSMKGGAAAAAASVDPIHTIIVPLIRRGAWLPVRCLGLTLSARGGSVSGRPERDAAVPAVAPGLAAALTVAQRAIAALPPLVDSRLSAASQAAGTAGSGAAAAGAPAPTPPASGWNLASTVSSQGGDDGLHQCGNSSASGIIVPATIATGRSPNVEDALRLVHDALCVAVADRPAGEIRQPTPPPKCIHTAPAPLCIAAALATALTPPAVPGLSAASAASAGPGSPVPVTKPPAGGSGGAADKEAAAAAAAAAASAAALSASLATALEGCAVPLWPNPTPAGVSATGVALGGAQGAHTSLPAIGLLVDVGAAAAATTQWAVDAERAEGEASAAAAAGAAGSGGGKKGEKGLRVWSRVKSRQCDYRYRGHAPRSLLHATLPVEPRSLLQATCCSRRCPSVTMTAVLCRESHSCTRT